MTVCTCNGMYPHEDFCGKPEIEDFDDDFFDGQPHCDGCEIAGDFPLCCAEHQAHMCRLCYGPNHGSPAGVGVHT